MLKKIATGTLLDAVTATGAGETKSGSWAKRAFFAYGTTSAGAGAATIVIEVSGKASQPSANEDWLTLGTINLTLGTTQVADGFASDAAWPWVRARVTAISGTGAAVTATMSAETGL